MENDLKWTDEPHESPVDEKCQPNDHECLVALVRQCKEYEIDKIAEAIKIFDDELGIPSDRETFMKIYHLVSRQWHEHFINELNKNNNE